MRPRRVRGAYPLPVVAGEAAHGDDAAAPGEAACRPDAPLVLDARATIAAVVDDVARGRRGCRVIAARFHHALAGATADGRARASPSARGLDTVVLSGGVFQNRVLLDRTAADLATRRAARARSPSGCPPTTAGIAFGQAAVAAARTRGWRPCSAWMT